mmetsp:Transcript_46631/g.146116  ORF Transcript_46631/g.146116 Transcript_46631/m.146116 type:complete len:250 (-) Transcript_46631:431-1180(-)
MRACRQPDARARQAVPCGSGEGLRGSAGTMLLACLVKVPLGEVLRVELVHPHVAVLTPGDEAPPVAEPGNGVHRAEVALDGANLLLVDHVPQEGLELPGGTSSGGHVLGVLASAHEDVHLGVLLRVVEGGNAGVVQRAVSLVRLDEGEVIHRPQLRVHVLGGRDQQRPVLRKVHAGDGAIVGLDQVEILAALRVPDDHSPLLEDRDESLVERAPLDLGGLHGQSLLDGEQPLLLRQELPHHDAIGNNAL